jgi:recombination protein RecA
MSQALRKLAGTLNRAGTICIFTNQLREKIGVMFGSPETTPGGRALKFYSSVRLDIRRTGSIKDADTVIGSTIRVKVVKNKCASPFRQATFEMMFGEGISGEGELIDLGDSSGALERSGSWYSFGEHRLGQGRERVRQFLKDNPDIAMEIAAAVRERLGLAPPLSAREDEFEAAAEAPVNEEALAVAS